MFSMFWSQEMRRILNDCCCSFQQEFNRNIVCISNNEVFGLKVVLEKLMKLLFCFRKIIQSTTFLIKQFSNMNG